MTPTLLGKKCALALTNLLLAAPWIVIGPLYHFFITLKSLIQEFNKIFITVRHVVEGNWDSTRNKPIRPVEPSNALHYLFLAGLLMVPLILTGLLFITLYQTFLDLTVLVKQVIYFDDQTIRTNINGKECNMKHSFVETLKFNLTIGEYKKLQDQDIIGCLQVV